MDDAAFAELFPDELTREQVQDLRAALERRLGAVREGVLKLPAEEVAQLEQSLAVMRQEEVIAAFIEGPVLEVFLQQERLDALEGEEQP